MAKKAASDKPLTPLGGSDAKSPVLLNIDIGKIKHGPNVRQDFGDISSLAESITLHGILEPLIVECQDDGSYLLLAGGRRYHAALEAGIQTVPAVAHPALSEPERLQIMLVENLSRKDLNPVEEAEGIKLLYMSGMSQADIASRLSVSQPYVANRIRLLEAPDCILDLVKSGRISASHVISLLRFKDLPATVLDLLYQYVLDIVNASEEPIPLSKFASNSFYKVDLPEYPELYNELCYPISYEPEYKCCKSCPDNVQLGFCNYCFKPSCFNRNMEFVKSREQAEKKQKSSKKTDAVDKKKEVEAYEAKYAEFRGELSNVIWTNLDNPRSVQSILSKLIRDEYSVKSYPELHAFVCSVMGKEFEYEDLSALTDSEVYFAWVCSLVYKRMPGIRTLTAESLSIFVESLKDAGFTVTDRLVNLYSTEESLEDGEDYTADGEDYTADSEDYDPIMGA